MPSPPSAGPASDFLISAPYSAQNCERGGLLYHAVHIDGYRGLESFEMRNLGQVNLLVGRNNSGKTSVLEALHLLSYGTDISALWQLCGRRGERFGEDPNRYSGEMEIDISHLFSGHDLAIGSRFEIMAYNKSPERSVAFEVIERKKEQGEKIPVTISDDGILRQRLALQISMNAPNPPRRISLTPRGGINSEYIEPSRLPVSSGRRSSALRPTSHLISTESISSLELTHMWDRIQLTPQEGLVLEALQFIDPHIEQIRATGSARYFGDRGGFIIKRSDFRMPFPLGSMGDGAWRMLAMAIVLTQCANGVLLVDEIDTGLHYTVMSDMWRLIINTARELNIQVFATTHSYDCVQSLSVVCDPEDDIDVTIQRLESGRKRSIPYSEAEIRMAAKRRIEIR